MIWSTQNLGRLRRQASRARLRVMGALGTRSGQRCCVCDREVAGFVWLSYRPFGCPYCGSSPRERFAMYALQQGLVPGLPEGGRVLHLAPNEHGLVRWFRSRAGDYVPGDLEPELYRDLDVERVDLTTTTFAAPFDVIYASHILEHIPDDRQAMRNMREHLVPGGHALILVPLRGETTDEGGPDLSGAERRQRYGQPDHVRQYGMDIVGRLQESGFEVRVVDAGAAGPETIARYGFETHGYQGDPETDRIFVATRPS